MQDIGLMIAAIYFSSLMYVIVHVLGLISGAVAGWIMRGGSITAWARLSAWARGSCSC